MTSNHQTSRPDTWRRYFGDLNTRVTPDADLVLSAKDLYIDSPEPVAQWALAKGFVLGDIDPAGALSGLLFNTVIRALADVDNDDPLVTGMAAVRLGASPQTLPDFRVLVDGEYVAALLVNTYDGPFADEAIFQDALAIRIPG